MKELTNWILSYKRSLIIKMLLLNSRIVLLLVDLKVLLRVINKI